MSESTHLIQFRPAVAHDSPLTLRNVFGIEARFYAKVDASGGLDACWLWTGARDKEGYGLFAINGRNQLAHRVAMALHDGDNFRGLNVLHHCDNRACVNPAHLFLGTQQDNIADMVAKERHTRGSGHIWSRNRRRAQGEQNGRAKLTAADVRSIRQRYANGGVTLKALAHEFGVSDQTILGVVKRKIWRSVE